MKKYLFPLLLLCFGLTVQSCGDDDEVNEWQVSNTSAFAGYLAQAKDSIAQAQSLYGDQWEDHCNWRVYRSYLLTGQGVVESTDTIAVQILQRSASTVSPLYTDSVRLNYAGYLTDGTMFDHSGTSYNEADIFSASFSLPKALAVSNTVEGFTTALLRMHLGDFWRVYIPAELAYGSSSLTSVPAYSMLIFKMQLKGIYRKGTSTGTWQ